MKNCLNNLRSRFFGALASALNDTARTSPATKLAISMLSDQWRTRAKTGQPLPDNLGGGARIFSQFEEDGLLIYLDAVLELKNKLFIDVGSANGINSNCANLALNMGWYGLFIDGNSANIAQGRKYYENHPDTMLFPPVFVEAFITRENINDSFRMLVFQAQSESCQ